MIIIKPPAGKKKQNGLALLVLLVVVALTFTVYYFSNISLVKIENDNKHKTQQVLKQAKAALLAYAVTNWQIEGSGKIAKLPCVDNNGANPVGEQDPNCGNAYANTIGYFPWRTLGQDILKGSSGNCLLYAVSPAYKMSPIAALNPDSYGQFLIVDSVGDVLQGLSPEDRPVAVIIAPGKTLLGQIRDNLDDICDDYNNVAGYLDDDGTTDNAAIGTDNITENFVQLSPGSEEGANPLNDSLITISHREFWDALESSITSAAFKNKMKVLTEAIALCVAAYGDDNEDHLPMPVALNINEYRRTSDYDDSGDFTTAFAGRLPYDISEVNARLESVNPDNNDILFKNSFCDDIDLTSTTPSPEEHIWFTNPASPPALAHDRLQGEYYDLWTNWKDHFFYAISREHNPDNDTVDTCDASNCVSVNGNSTLYAGIVFFSGLKQGNQRRYGSPFDGVNDKDDVANYLEEGRATVFPDNDGNGVFPDVTAADSNDIMFCIKTDMSVEQCP